MSHQQAQMAQQEAIRQQQMMQQQNMIHQQEMMRQQHAAAQQQQQQMRHAPGVPPQQGVPKQGKPGGQQAPPQGTPIVVEPGYAQGPAARVHMEFDDGGGWLDSAPGVAMEYKVHVEAGKEDCYWQYVHAGATFYVSAQVLKGGDGAIGMAVRNP